jgi:hypothetical protein
MRKPIACLSLIAATALSLGCPKSVERTGEADEKAAETKPAQKAYVASNQAEKKSSEAPSARSIPGLGEVLAWSPTKLPTATCKLAGQAKAKVDSIDKGAVGAIGDGTADLAALRKEVTDPCGANLKPLVVALNNAGFRVYGKKKYTEANRYWAAALSMHPGFALARFNLACGLALDGKPDAAIWAIGELARAVNAVDDPEASNLLEKAKSDDDLKSVRDAPAFQEALKASTGGLVGPRGEPELAKEAVKLLPKELNAGVEFTGEKKTYHPAFLKFWTWRPDAETELLVGTLTGDPATLGKPKFDNNAEYSGFAVLQRDGKIVRLLVAHKTGEEPPIIAAGRGGTVRYKFSTLCAGEIKGTISFAGGRVVVKEQTCNEANAEDEKAEAAKSNRR